MLRVIADTSDAANDMRQLGQETDSFGQRAAKVAAVAAGFAAITGGIMKAAQAASALEQSTGGVEAVFKSSADQIKKWADQAATSIGLSKSQYQDLATLIGSQLKNAGVAMDDLAPSTNRLIQQGADLAAMFGGTTAQAVESISAALKGERDPIEKYGITLTEAGVQAEILALGLDTSTTAAQQTAKAMATMSLITKQGGDAWGAAAREADTFAAQQQVLQAVFENTMAEIGSIFLPTLADLAGAFAKMAPVIATILSPLAEVLNLVLGLPAPILAVAAAFAAWQFFGIGGRIVAMFTGMQTAATNFSQHMQVQNALAGGSLTKFQQAVATAQSQYGGLLRSIGQAGVWAAVAAVVTVVTNAITGWQEAQQKGKDAAASMVDVLVEQGGRWNSVAEQALAAKAANTEAFSEMISMGISSEDAMRALTGSWEDWDSVVAAAAKTANGFNAPLMAEVDAFRRERDAVEASALAKVQATQATLQAAEAATAAGTATEAQTQLLQEQAVAAAKAAVEASKVATEQTGVATAMRDAEAATAAATRATQAFGLAMDQLAGRNITAEQAALALNNGMRGLQEAFTGAADKGGYSADALAAWDVAALTATAGGASLYGALNDVRSGYDQTVSSAFLTASATQDAAGAMTTARAAADSAYQGFLAMAQAQGLSSDQAVALAAKLGIVAGTDIPDKTFKLIAQDQQAQASLTAAQQAEIDTKTFDVNALIAPAQGQFSMLTGQKLTNQVSVTADTKPAESALTSTTSAQRSTTVTTQANTSPAQSTLQGFTSAQRSTSIDVQANTTAAQSAITALVTQHRVLTIQVEANTAPAQNAINNIQGKTVQVTVQQNTIQTVTPAPAAASLSAPMTASAPMMMSALAVGDDPAPLAGPTPAGPVAPFHRNALATDTGSEAAAPAVVNNFTINGALDPVAVARQIDTLLTREERRRTGVRIGGT